jgi:hypothetical protein
MATLLIVVPPRQEVVKHVAVLLFQCGGDGHDDALGKTTSRLALDILAHFC